MDAAVGDECLEGHASGLATNGLEAREQDGLRGVVDDERDARDLLEGADVSTLAADDAALEIVGGDVHGGDGDLAGLVGGAALDGRGHDLAGGLVGLGSGTLLALAENLGLLAHGVLAHAVEELPVGVLGGKGGDALELACLLLAETLEVARATVELASLAGELVLAAVERVVPTVERLLALHDAALERVEFALALLLVGLGSLAELENLLLGGKDRLLLGGLGLALGIDLELLGGVAGLADLAVSLLHACRVLVVADVVGDGGAYEEAHQRGDDADYHSDS